MNFQVWPGDEHFGGNFDPSSLPTYTYVDWVRFSSLQEYLGSARGALSPFCWFKVPLSLNFGVLGNNS